MQSRVSTLRRLAGAFGTALLLSPLSHSQTILFADSFERASADDINASSDGIVDNTSENFSATGAYVENYWGGGASVRTNVGGDGGNAANNGNPGILFLADGVGTSNIFLNHNFIDPVIIADGGFSVSFDVSAISTLVDTGQGAAFAIGMTEAEAIDTGDAMEGGGSSDGNHKMQDGINGGANTAVDVASSDFWLVLRGDGDGANNTNLLLWGGEGNFVDQTNPTGPAANQVVVPAEFGTIRVDFQFADFNAGSSVAFEIFFNGNSVGTGGFQWSDTGSNYIGLDARGGYIGFDNLEIATLANVEPAASLVASPTAVSSAGKSPVTLNWSTLAFPSAATYTITADKPVTYPSGGDSGSVTSGADSGSLTAQVDGALGDVTFTFEASSGATVLATATKLVSVNQVTVAQSQNLLRLADNGSPEDVILTIDGTNFPSAGSYEISDDNNGAVTYNVPTSGSLVLPLQIDATVDPTAGDVTFTVLLKDSEGNVFDTRTFVVAAEPSAPALASVLFADSYDRSVAIGVDYEDIDFVSDGMSGTLSPLAYQEVWEGSGPASVQISLLDTLQAATGAGMSCWFVDHNFTDSAIATDGGFSVSMQVVSIDSPSDDLNDRFAGFGIGMSREESETMGDEGGVTGTGPRGSVQAGVARGKADFYLSVSRLDDLQIFSNGLPVAQIPVDGDGIFGDNNSSAIDSPVVLRADFTFEEPTNFTKGSFVHYTVYCNEVRVTSGYFKLTNEAENFVAFSARATNLVEIDNLAIGTFAGSYPGNPESDPGELAIDNLTTEELLGVTAMDFTFSGTEGVFYEVTSSPDLQQEFQGIGRPGAAIPNIISVFGKIEGQPVTVPAVAPPVLLEFSGFYRAEAFHWPDAPAVLAN